MKSIYHDSMACIRVRENKVSGLKLREGLRRLCSNFNLGLLFIQGQRAVGARISVPTTKAVIDMHLHCYWNILDTGWSYPYDI